jgi:hypothetical protein
MVIRLAGGSLDVAAFVSALALNSISLASILEDLMEAGLAGSIIFDEVNRLFSDGRHHSLYKCLYDWRCNAPDLRHDSIYTYH